MSFTQPSSNKFPDDVSDNPNAYDSSRSRGESIVRGRRNTQNAEEYARALAQVKSIIQNRLDNERTTTYGTITANVSSTPPTPSTPRRTGVPNKRHPRNVLTRQSSFLTSRDPSPPPILGIEGENAIEPPSPLLVEQGMVNVHRPVYSQHEFNKLFEEEYYKKNIYNKFLDSVFVPDECCSTRRCLDYVEQFLPIVKTVKNYKVKDNLLLDAISGLTTGVTRIPQAMAYALLAKLSPIYGLYTAFFAGLLYIFLGTSHHLALAAQGVVSLMVGSAVASYMTVHYSVDIDNITKICGSSYETCQIKEDVIMVMVTTTLLVGCIQFLFGLVHLGMITNYLSDPLIGGFTNGAVMQVIGSQLETMFGFHVPSHGGDLKLPKTIIYIFGHMTEANYVTLLISLASFFLLLIVKIINSRFKKILKIPIPGELIIMIIMTTVSWQMELDKKHDVAIVGDVPRGFLPPSMPNLRLTGDLFMSSLTIAIVAYAVSISVAKKFAIKHDYELDSNQEFVAYGISNIVGSFFNCFTNTASMSCSSLHEALGGRTQFANSIASMLVLLVMLALGALFEPTPNAVLSAIILINLKSIIWQFGDLPSLWKISKIDFSIWVITWLTVVLLDVDIGLGVGIGYSLLTVVFRSQWPYTCLLGRIPNTDIYKNINITPNALHLDGIKVFRFEGALYFASADHFRERLIRDTGLNPRKLIVAQQHYLEKLKLFRKSAKKMIFPEFMDEQFAASYAQSADIMDKRMFNNEAQSEMSVLLGKDAALLNTTPHFNEHHLIIDLSACSFIDSVGLRALRSVVIDFREVGTDVYLANVRAAVRVLLWKASKQKSGAVVDDRHIFLTVHDAVLSALDVAQKHKERDWVVQDSVIMARQSSLRRHHVSRRHSFDTSSIALPERSQNTEPQNNGVKRTVHQRLTSRRQSKISTPFELESVKINHNQG